MLDALPLSLHIPELGVLVVHAGVVPRTGGEEGEWGGRGRGGGDGERGGGGVERVRVGGEGGIVQEFGCGACTACPSHGVFACGWTECVHVGGVWRARGEGEQPSPPASTCAGAVMCHFTAHYCLAIEAHYCLAWHTFQYLILICLITLHYI